MVVPKLVRSASDAGAPRPGFLAELDAGWQFLRHETVLLANTLQGTVGQFSLGLSIALTPSFVQTAFGSSGFAWQASYGFLETGIGIGNLIGGFAVGLVGARFMKGRMVILGYTLWGVLILLFALSNNLGVAIGLAFGQGVANMIFVIPSQTLFQERTPQRPDGSRSGVPLRAGLRLDDGRDAARIGPRPGLRAGAGHGGLRARHGRSGPGGALFRRRCATPDAGARSARPRRDHGFEWRGAADARCRRAGPVWFRCGW